MSVQSFRGRAGLRVVKQAVDLGGRVPPHDRHTEAALLSAMLEDRRSIDTVRGILRDAEDFYADPHRRVAEVIFDLHDRGQAVDPVTVAHALKDRDRLQAVGGVSFLSTLIGRTPLVAHVEAYARLVRSKARRRDVIAELQLAAAQGYDENQSDDDYVAETGERVFRACAIVRDEGVHSIRELIAEDETRLAKIERGELHDPSIPTHYPRIDDAIGGLFPGEVTVIGAKPGIGKTAFGAGLAVRIARNSHNDHELGVLFFSVEMRRQRLMWRWAASEAGINTKRLRSGKLRPSERSRLTTAHHALEQLPIFVDDSAAQSPMRMRARLRRLQSTFDRPPKYDDQGRLARLGRRVAIVIVDYLTLLQPDHVERGQTREQVVGGIAESLRLFAAETGVHVVELAQLKKDLQGKDQMPTLSDLRESGQIEQAAHNIGFIHRPEYYVTDKEKLDPELRGLALASFPKSRDGDPTVVRLHFSGWCTRFDPEGFKPVEEDAEETARAQQDPQSDMFTPDADYESTGDTTP